MSFRGRGRGRGGFGGRGFGRGGGGFGSKPLPYILFPEDVTLPSLPDVGAMSKEEKLLIASKYRLEQFWVTSCYHLEQDAFPKIEKSEDGKRIVKVAESNAEDAEIERYSDRFKQKVHGKREALESYLKQTPSNFPAELIQGARLQRVPKKLRWDQDSGDGKDFFAKLEEAEGKAKGKEDHFKKDEDEDEVEVEEEGEEESDDGDYNQNIDFDDDDDDFNIDEGPDEDFFGGED